MNNKMQLLQLQQLLHAYKIVSIVSRENALGPMYVSLALSKINLQLGQHVLALKILQHTLGQGRLCNQKTSQVR